MTDALHRLPDPDTAPIAELCAPLSAHCSPRWLIPEEEEPELEVPDVQPPRRPRYHADQEERARRCEVVARYASAGLTARQISEATGLKDRTVRDVAQLLGIKLTPVHPKQRRRRR